MVYNFIILKLFFRKMSLCLGKGYSRVVLYRFHILTPFIENVAVTFPPDDDFLLVCGKF